MYDRKSFSHKKHMAFGDIKDVLSESQKISLLIYNSKLFHKRLIPAYFQRKNGPCFSLAWPFF